MTMPSPTPEPFEEEIPTEEESEACLGCAAHRLRVTGCQGCASIQRLVHLAMDMVMLADMRDFHQRVAVSRRNDTYEAIIWTVVVSIMAIAGVRSAVGYVIVIFLMIASTLVGAALFERSARKEHEQARNDFFKRVGIEPPLKLTSKELVDRIVEGARHRSRAPESEPE